MFEKKTDYQIKTNLKKRILATLLDLSFFSCLLTLTFYLLKFILAFLTIEFGTQFIIVSTFIIYQLYFPFCEGFLGGTFGYLIFGLKVLTIERNDIDLSHSIKRHMLDPIDILLILPGILSIKNSRFHQRLGDQSAGTIVVDKNDLEQYPQNHI